MLLTLQEAAEQTGKSIRQIRYLIQTERLKARKLRGVWRIDRDDLPKSEEWLRADEAKEHRIFRALVNAGGVSEDPMEPAGDAVGTETGGEVAAEDTSRHEEASGARNRNTTAADTSTRATTARDASAADTSARGDPALNTGTSNPPANLTGPAPGDSLAALAASPIRHTYSVQGIGATAFGVAIYQALLEALGAHHPATVHVREAMMQLACGCHAFLFAEKRGFYGRAREEASRATMALLLDARQMALPMALLEHQFMPALNGLIRKAERDEKKQNAPPHGTGAQNTPAHRTGTQNAPPHKTEKQNSSAQGTGKQSTPPHRTGEGGKE